MIQNFFSFASQKIELRRFYFHIKYNIIEHLCFGKNILNWKFSTSAKWESSLRSVILQAFVEILITRAKVQVFCRIRCSFIKSKNRTSQRKLSCRFTATLVQLFALLVCNSDNFYLATEAFVSRDKVPRTPAFKGSLHSRSRYSLKSIAC